MTGSIPTTEASSSSKKPRASKPKVKTGCITCKQRRVKCDETKPECLRCSNFGRKCAGYPPKEEPVSVKEHTLPVPRRLLSKAMMEVPSSSRSPSPSPSPSPVPLHARAAPAPAPSRPSMPPGLVFQDERQYQYFCHFRDHTAVELSSGFEPALWNVLVLQACDIPAILKLTVATAALSLARRSAHSGEKDAHHQHALQQYGDALKGIREMVAMGQDSMRIALISALLIFCFESLHGDLGRAIAHVQSAIDMIVKRISNAPRSFYFPRVNALGIRGGTAIDDDLLTAFMRLDRPSLTLLSRRKENAPLLTARIFTLLFSEEHLEIPRRFATTAEARVYLEDIKWRVLTTTQPPKAVMAFWEDDSDEPQSPQVESIPHQLKQWYEATGVLNATSNLSMEFAHWHDAFSPLLNYAISPAGESLFIGAVTLHIQALAADLLVSGSTRSSLSAPAASSSSAKNMNRFPTVQAILSFSRRLVAHPKFLKGFVFDICIIPALVKVFMICPDRDMKQEVIDLLKSMEPRKEGVWDSAAIARAGELSLEQEDGEMDLDMIDPNLLEAM